jgi:hypothetical protein
MRELYDDFLAHRKRQTAGEAPRTALRRLGFLATEIFPQARIVLIPLAIVGLFAIPPVFVAAGIGVVLLFAAHVPYAHERSWTVYYLEIVPIIALLCAAGSWRAATWLGHRSSSPRIRAHAEQHAAILAVGAAAFLLAVLPISMRYWRQRRDHASAFVTQFDRVLNALPSRPAIVFVRYAPTRPHYVNVIRNHADPGSAPVWVVHDLGARNLVLRQAAPERAAYLFDEADLQLRRQP